MVTNWDNYNFVDGYFYAHIHDAVYDAEHTPDEVRREMLARWWTEGDLAVLDGYVSEYMDLRRVKLEAAQGDDWDWPTIRHTNQRRMEVMREAREVIQARVFERARLQQQSERQLEMWGGDDADD